MGKRPFLQNKYTISSFPPSSVVLHDGVHPAEVLVHVRVGGGLQAEAGGPVVVPEAGHAVDGGGAVGGADAAVAAGVALGKKSD